ncbi:MAG: hypothetical protein GYA43_11420 [Bacteroidales bacterium]|nr:hypothetical protein [Bacteroidales bacterium]
MKFIIIGLVFLCSCGNTRINDKIFKAIGEDENNITHNQPCKTKVTNNEIVRNIFTIDIFTSDTTTIKNLCKTPPIIETIKEKGIYDNNEYTIYVLKIRNSLIKFFHNNEGFYIEEAIIKGDDIKLYNNISIGMLKEDFCKQISIKNSKCDTISIMDEDQTINLNFIFSNKILKELLIETFN